MSYLPLFPDEDDSVADIGRVNAIFENTKISDILDGMDQQNNKLAFKLACDKILETNLDIDRKNHYKNFLRLYLHQKGIFHRALKLIRFQLGKKNYDILGSGAEYKVNIFLKNKDLYIEDEFFIKKLIPVQTNEVKQNDQTVESEPEILEPEIDDYFFHGKTQFKLEMIQQNGLYALKLVILQATLDCPDPYFRKIVDERSFLEKLIDFLRAIFSIAIHTPVQVLNFFPPPNHTTSSFEEEQSTTPTRTLSSCSN